VGSLKPDAPAVVINARGYADGERICTSGAAQAGSSPVPTARGGGMPRLTLAFQGLPLNGPAPALLTAKRQQLRFAGGGRLRQPACSGLLPTLERSSVELAPGSRCRQTSRLRQLPARLKPGAAQGRFRPSLWSEPFHCRLTSNSGLPVASAWVQTAGSEPAGLGVQNDILKDGKGSQVASWARALPAPGRARAPHPFCTRL